MNGLTRDYITIDTNIFEHLLNKEKNICNHIGIILERLQQDNIRLLVDGSGRIIRQYEHRLSDRIRKGAMERRGEMYLLTYWINHVDKQKTILNHKDPLMTSIKKTLSGIQDTTDWIFVYVAFKNERILITNDRRELIDGGENPTESRRKQLMKITRKHKINGAYILDSKEAYKQLNREETQ